MTDNKALDLLGIKGISDSVRVATQGTIEGAAAFLSRVCLPAAEEFGLALRDRISHWRAKNAARMLNRANEINLSHDPNPTERVSPRLAHVAIEEASWIEDDQVQAMWSGLLASSTSRDGRSDENLLFMNILKQLSSLQLSILRFAVQNPNKEVISPHGFIASEGSLRVPVTELAVLFGTEDLQRIDRELDHLRELGLIGGPVVLGMDGGIHPLSGTADLTPTPLSLHLYVRAQGSKLPPTEYWNLAPPEDEKSAERGGGDDLKDAVS